MTTELQERPGSESTASLTLRDGSGFSATDAPLQRGAHLDRYVILRAVGSGGMGNVYAAYDTELERRVAIKLLRGDVVAKDRDGAQERLRREAKLIARLQHPNVVAVYDIGSVGETLYLAMELVEGRTVDEWIAAENPSWREILEVFLQAGEGLTAAHGAGLVHRDFKPSNVMLDDRLRPRVLDFGLARVVDAAALIEEGGAGVSLELETSRIWATRTGAVLGTPGYMAPEQLSGGTVDARADQFAFCASLYRALHGTRPFAGKNVEELLGNIQAARTVELPSTSKVPAHVRRLLLRGLAAGPEARFADMSTLLAALEKAPRRGRRVTRASLVAGAMASVGVIAILVSNPARPVCTGFDYLLDGTWDTATQSRLHQRFLDSNVPFAEPAWKAFASRVSRYTQAWTAMRTEACQATQQRGEQSAELMDRRMACLDERLAEVRSLGGLVQASDPMSLSATVSAADGLSSLAGCADRAALLALVPPPENQAASTVKEVRDDLAAVRTEERAGRYPDAIRGARSALERAQAVGYQPLVGEAQIALARAVGRTGDLQAMREGLIDAASIATANHHYTLLAETYLQLIVVDWLDSQPAAARQWGRLAQATIKTLDGREDLEAGRHYYLGMVAMQEQKLDEAIGHYETFLELTPPDSTARTFVFNQLGTIYGRLGRFELAEQQLRRSLESTKATFGPQHPGMAAILQNLATLYKETGRFELAEQYARRALGIWTAMGAGNHPDVAFPLATLGSIAVLQGRPEEAIENLEHALVLRLRQPGYREDLSSIRYYLGLALWQTGGDRERAKKLVRDSQDGASPDQQQQALLWLAEHDG